MGWYIRKSIRLGGGVRLNLSKSGVGVSAGVKGFRVSTGPRGSYVNIGSHGIYYRQKIGGPSGQFVTPSPTLPPFSPSNIIPSYAIHTAEAHELVNETSAEVLTSINKCLQAPHYFTTVLVIGIILALWMLSLSPFLFLLVGIGTVGGSYWARQKDFIRRTYPLDFRLDAVGYAWWHKFNETISILGQGHYLWRVNGIEPTGDWKRNAGAKSLFNRVIVRLTKHTPPAMQSNVTPLCLDLGLQQLYFLPDRIYVYQQGKYGAVCYNELWFDCGQINFVEDGILPKDTCVVGETWKHPNKNGSPDLRFADNRRLPVCEYGLLGLRSPQGLAIVLQTSAVSTAQHFVQALRLAIAQAPFTASATSPSPPKTAKPFGGAASSLQPIPPKSPERAKECPCCKTLTALTTQKCLKCGHNFRTKFSQL